MHTTLRTAQYNNRNCCYVISPINSSTTRPRPRTTRAAQRTEQFTTRRPTTTGMQSRAEPGGSCISWFAGYEAQKENQNREFSRSRPRMHRQAQHCNHPPHSVGLQLSPFLLTFSRPAPAPLAFVPATHRAICSRNHRHRNRQLDGLWGPPLPEMLLLLPLFLFVGSVGV